MPYRRRSYGGRRRTSYARYARPRYRKTYRRKSWGAGRKALHIIERQDRFTKAQWMKSEGVRPKELHAAKLVKSQAWKIFKEEHDKGSWKDFLPHAHSYETKALAAIKHYLFKKHASKHISATREDGAGALGTTGDSKRRPPPEMMSEASYHSTGR